MPETRPTTPTRRWSNRQVRREVDHDRARWFWSLLLGVVVAASPLAFCVLQQNDCLNLTYQIGDLREQQRQLAERQRRLRAQVATLRSLDSIESWADRKGMIRPSGHEAVVVRLAASERGELLAWKSGAPGDREPVRRPQTALRR